MKNQILKHKRIWTCVALLFFFLTGRDCPHIIPGTLWANCLTPSGAAVAEAKVTLLNKKAQETRIVNAGAQGELTIPQVAPGSYMLTVTPPGFSIFTEHDIKT